MRTLLAVTLLLAAYLLLAVGTATTKPPIMDEGWYADPAYNLVAGRGMGTTVLEPHGPRHQGLADHTYWVMPLHIVTQAVLYRVVGEGLLTLRLLSVFWGLVLLGSLFQVLVRLGARDGPALLGVALTAVCAPLVPVMSVGRTDVMCAGLGMAGLATFLSLRDRGLGGALLAAQSLVVASGLTHPMGLAYQVGLFLLVIRLDRGRLQWGHLAAVLGPCLVGGGLWALYILEAPRDFLAQFLTSAEGRAGGALAPWQAVRGEVHRLAEAFGLGVSHGGLGRLRAVHLGFISAGLFIGIADRSLRRSPPVSALLGLAGAAAAILLLVEGAKQGWYLVHLLPLWHGVVALVVAGEWKSGRIPRALLAGVTVVVLLINLAGSAYLVWRNDRATSFQPVVDYLRGQLREGDEVIAGAEFGFDLGFSRIRDDYRLGALSGRRPRFIVLDGVYAGHIAEFEASEPSVHAHIRRLMDQECQWVFHNDRYRVCEPSPAASPAR